MWKQVLVAIATSGCAALPAFADPVYDRDVAATDFSGSRSTATGGGLGFASYGGSAFSASLSWTITQIGSIFTYRYDFDTPTGTDSTWNALSHLILDLSNDCGKSVVGSGATAVHSFESCFTNLRIGYAPNQNDPQPVSASAVEFGSFSGGSGNPQMPGTIVGAKFANGALPATIIFESDRVPVWGDIYVKQGNPDPTKSSPNGFAVWNLGLLAANRSSDDVGLFIARPDTHLVACTDGPCASVPVPATVGLLGMGLALIGGVSAFRRRG